MSNVEKRITAKMVLDDSGFSSTLKGINSEIKNNQSELRAASSGLQAFGRSTEGIERVQNALTKQIDLQNRKLETYRASMQKAEETLDKNVASRSKLTESIDREKQKLESLKRTYGENNQAVRNSEERLQELTEEFERVDNSILNNARRIESYQNNLNRTENDLNRATASLNRFNRELEEERGLSSMGTKLTAVSAGMKNFGSKASSVGSSLTMGLSMPLAGVAFAAGKVGLEFEGQMARVKAISGATGTEFKKLEDQALQLGQATSFSANQSAEGMENLASAGFSVNEITEAMPGLLDLAASSGEDLATSSDIAASTLRGFGLAANQVGHVADVLAKNAADTNAAVADTGEAMKYIAPVASTMGQSLEEVTASIGIMADAGIKGSQAGTTLRGALTRLAKPSDEAAAVMKNLGFEAYDSSGKMLPLNEIIGDLIKSTSGLTEQQQQQAITTIFGKDALSGMMALINAGPEKLETLTNAFENSDGAAKNMADTMQDNAKGKIKKALGSLETAGIKLLQVAAPAIENLAGTVEKLANKFSELSPGTQDFIVKAGAIAIAAGPIISIVGKLSSGIGGLIGTSVKVARTFGLISGGAEVATAAIGATSAATATASAGAVGASGALAGIGATLGSIALPVAAGVAGVAAVGYAGYKTAEYLNSSATPAVDLFADKAVYSSQTVVGASGAMSSQVQTDTIKISDSTKKAVQSYLNLDTKASSSLMNLRMNSDKFTNEAKNAVVKNFTDMSKKSSSLSKEQRESMTVNFQKLVSDTGTLTKKNKDEIIKQYTAMVNGTKGLTAKQKTQTIKDFTDTLTQSVALTKKQSTDMQKLYKDMGDKIKGGLDKQRDQELKSQKDFFAKSNVLSTKEETRILGDTKKLWDKKKATVDSMQKQINSIIQKAADEHRQITDGEAKTIDEIQKKMKDSAVKSLSANEVESKVILERMKDHSENITAEMAGSKIKELNKLRDSSINSANEECDKRIGEIIRMRDETKVISADQADKLIADANRQKDDTIKAAQETRDKAVNEITSMNKDITKDVNTTTGDVKSNWDKMKDWWNSWVPSTKEFKVVTSGTGHVVAQQNWTGNSSFKGGLTTLHERGEELYDLPEGTRIYNHQMSEQMVLETAKETAKGLIDSIMNNKDFNSSNDINLNLAVNLDGNVIANVADKINGKKQNLERRMIGGRI